MHSSSCLHVCRCPTYWSGTLDAAAPLRRCCISCAAKLTAVIRRRSGLMMLRRSKRNEEARIAASPKFEGRHAFEGEGLRRYKPRSPSCKPYAPVLKVLVSLTILARKDFDSAARVPSSHAACQKNGVLTIRKNSLAFLSIAAIILCSLRSAL